ncbi:AraC family transcriptional regulator [Paenibacillus sp. GYB003]|uniref:AraC family transcriptional regulator n=1 Tax=Paenibacillus sp. GYB003 TaxID=2994392 RepID=UPI002F9633C8
MMHEQSGLSFHSIPILSLLDIRQSVIADGNIPQKSRSEHYSIWWFKQCRANLEVDGAAHLVGPDGCALVPPRSAVGVLPADPGSEKPEAFEMVFMANEAAASLIGSNAAVFSAGAESVSGIVAVLDLWGAAGGLAPLRLQIRFQELVLLLLEQRDRSSKTGAEREVEETIHYLSREYSKDIRIEKLAEQTALSRWKYNDMFKTLTGKTPVQFLTELRIDRAKQLLVGSDQRLKEIAEQTGFGDEYYFSRRFKQYVGVSPTQFVRMQSREMRICCLHSLGDLLPLGVVPVGSDRYRAELYGEEARGVQSLDEPVDMEKLYALQPDLIVCPSYMPKQQYDRLAAVAPTALLDWQDDIYTRLFKLGRLLGRSYKAKAWIESYRNKAQNIRRQLKPYVREGESAAAFVYHRKGLYVYGGHNFGHTLYEGLGFVPPDRISTFMTKKKSLKWKKIALEDLPLYSGDRVFMAVENKDRNSRQFMDIIQSEAWNSLPAVGNERSYIVEHRWGLYDALTLERHLDEMLPLLTP